MECNFSLFSWVALSYQEAVRLASYPIFLGRSPGTRLLSDHSGYIRPYYPLHSSIQHWFWSVIFWVRFTVHMCFSSCTEWTVAHTAHTPTRRCTVATLWKTVVKTSAVLQAWLIPSPPTSGQRMKISLTEPRSTHCNCYWGNGWSFVAVKTPPSGRLAFQEYNCRVAIIEKLCHVHVLHSHVLTWVMIFYHWFTSYTHMPTSTPKHTPTHATTPIPHTYTHTHTHTHTQTQGLKIFLSPH